MIDSIMLETTYNNTLKYVVVPSMLRLQSKKLDEKTVPFTTTAITPAGEKYYYNRNTKARTYDKDDGTCKTEQQFYSPK